MRHLRLYLTAALSLALYASGTARAEPPSLMPIQGVLTDAGGGLIDGEVSVTFRLYDAETKGDVLHEETQTVPVMRGRFVVYLGTEADLDLAIFRDNVDVFLGIAVEEDAEASPRLRLGTAPYAASATFCSEANLLSGMEADDFAPADHTHPPDNAATRCDDNEYLDGDGTCKAVSTMTDTNAETKCADDLYLRGDGTCQPMTQDTTLDQGTVEGWARGVCVDEGQANSITSAMVVANSLTAADLAANSVGSSEMDDNAVGSAEVINGSLTYSDTNVDSIQRRVNGSCPAGQAIRVINSNGTVTCEPIFNSGGSDTWALGSNNTGASVNSGTTNGNLVNASVTAPGPGTLIINAYARVRSDVAGASSGSLRLHNNSSTGSYWTWTLTNWSSTGTGDTKTLNTTYLYNVPSSGTQTIYMHGYCSGGVTCEYAYLSLQLRFVPF